MWNEDAWQGVESIFKQITTHPFITELADGTLSNERFIFYIRQDIIYLAELSISINSVASRLGDSEYADLFKLFAKESMEMEQSLQSKYAEKLNIQNTDRRTPACAKYSAYEAHNATHESVAVALATMLPCYWVYQCVGDYIIQSYKTENNPYKDWIELYSDPYFANEVAQFIKICNAYADISTPETVEKMTEAFVKSTQFEFDFWDDAYNMRYL